MAAQWIFEPIAKRHDRSGFLCGNGDLDAYLQRFARPHARGDTSSTHVAIEPEQVVVRAYYSLAMASVAVDLLPDARQGLPHVIPAALIARLGVDRPFQGRGLGELLLFDALARIARVSKDIAAYAVVVDAIDGRAATFYWRYGFAPLRDDELHLFLTLSDARDVVQGP